MSQLLCFSYVIACVKAIFLWKLRLAWWMCCFFNDDYIGVSSSVLSSDIIFLLYSCSVLGQGLLFLKPLSFMSLYFIFLQAKATLWIQLELLYPTKLSIQINQTVFEGPPVIASNTSSLHRFIRIRALSKSIWFF